MAIGEIAAVGGGAAVGAWLRWWLGIALNPVFPMVPLGTLTANLVGGLMMGVAMELLSRLSSIPGEMRLLLTTGFLGGLTTFSAFSSEVTALMLRRELLWALATIAAHVIGSLLMTLLGIVATRALFAWADA